MITVECYKCHKTGTSSHINAIQRAAALGEPVEVVCSDCIPRVSLSDQKSYGRPLRLN